MVLVHELICNPPCGEYLRMTIKVEGVGGTISQFTDVKSLEKSHLFNSPMGVGVGGG